MFVHRKQVFHFIPSLDKNAQNAIRFVARSCGYAFCHFFLYHARAARDKVFVVQHLEKYLAGDIIRIVPGQYERFSVEQFG